MTQRLTACLRREQIAEVALNLVAERGIRALTVRNVARIIGVTAPALYRHFPGGKHDILESIGSLLRESHESALKTAKEQQGSCTDILQRFAAEHLKLLLRYKAVPLLIFSKELWNEFPDLGAKLEQDFLQKVESLDKIFTCGQQKGEFRTDIPSRQITIAFFSIFLTLAALNARPSVIEINPYEQMKADFLLFMRAVQP